MTATPKPRAGANRLRLWLIFVALGRITMTRSLTLLFAVLLAIETATAADFASVGKAI
jgi:hypothetical protein